MGRWERCGRWTDIGIGWVTGTTSSRPGLDFRERIGRSVAKSKRREIAELRAEVVRLRLQVSAVALRVELMEAAEAEREAFEQIRRTFGD